jgi:excisionase family DNA binding protein
MPETNEKPTTFDRRAFSPREFAIVSGLGRSTVYELIKSGSLVARKAGKRTLILAEDGERFLRSLPAAR